MCVVSSVLEATTGPGVVPLWTELRDGSLEAMRRVFRLKKEDDETWENYSTRAARAARKM